MSMINLMPDASKQDIRYARYNARLVRWTIGCLIVIAIMLATVVLGAFYIDRTKNSLSSSIEQGKANIATQKLDEVQKEAEELSQGVKLIVQVLSKEVQFSKLLQQIGTLMPAGATLGEIQLSSKVNGALDMTANAVDYQTATQVQVNLQDKNTSLFEKVDTLSVNCNDTQTDTTINARYKCQIQVRALFKKDAAVTFLSGGSQ